MAVQNYKTNYDATAQAGTVIPAVSGVGVPTHDWQVTVAIASADDDGSTYLIRKDVPAQEVIEALEIENDSITAGTSYSIGLADPDTGAIILANCYANALDLSSASTKVAPKDGLAALTHANSKKQVYEVAGHNITNRRGRYDLVLTATTVGSGNGNVTFRGVSRMA